MWCCVFKKLVISCPTNGSHTSYSSQAVSGRVEGALEALEQEEQQRRDRAPAQCWELQKLHTNRPATRKVQGSRGAWRGTGGASRGKSFGVGTLITGNISPGEAGGERPCRGRGSLSEGLEAGGVGIRDQGAGSPAGPLTRPCGVRRVRKTGVGASGGPGDGLRTLHLILP